MSPGSSEKSSSLKKLLMVLLFLTGLVTIGAWPAYLLTRYAVNRYFDKWGTKLAALEKRGLLSKEFGAGWQDVLAGKSMERQAARITSPLSPDTAVNVHIVDGIMLGDYPSLSIIDRLREIRSYSNSIRVIDRNGEQLALIKTDHRRAPISEFPATLKIALIAAEDRNFASNNLGYEFGSFFRAALRAGFKTIITGRRQSMRGTSTLTQQVAKLFISRLDETGRRHVSRSLDRKIRELRLAVALRKLYSGDDILEVYMNHCVTSDHSLVGYKDIAGGLFNKELFGLSDAECVYLSRIVKWGRNVRPKIIAQCRVDMPRIGKALGWDAQRQKDILARIDSLSFIKPRRIDAGYGPLVDLANEFWLAALKRNGFSDEQTLPMDIIDPNSLIRKKGNLDITLTISAPLQRELESLVKARGYGPDTTLLKEFIVARYDKTVERSVPPRDTFDIKQTLRDPVDFREPGSADLTSLNPGDTVYYSAKYKKTGKEKWRHQSVLKYRKPVVVDGQYFAYSIMDSKTGELLAYYSKDRLGSRLACLLKNRTPNGSSTAKPVLNALNFDIGTFQPWSRWSDSVEVTDNVPWKRAFEKTGSAVTGAVFAHSAVPGRGYAVHNHNGVIEGCQYVFDLLATSNNILGVETAYRLNRTLFEKEGSPVSDAFPLIQFFYRIGALSRIKDSLKIKSVTGVRVYKELARVVGVNGDSVMASGRRAPMSDSQYSIALGTFELSLYEQMHIFNMFYQNDLIERPAEHPSLVIQSIVLNGDTLEKNDTVRRFHPFVDISNIRPTLLGMHKRLVSNRADGLEDFDIPQNAAAPEPDTATGYSPDRFALVGPPSNFAKSGTTDDIMKPFNAAPESKVRTNYGLWNAVIRIDLAAFDKNPSPDVRDITVACIGECNTKYTGARDGKTLHRFLTRDLLKKAGIRSKDGFFKAYEKYLRTVTPPDENCGVTDQVQGAGQITIEGRGD